MLVNRKLKVCILISLSILSELALSLFYSVLCKTCFRSDGRLGTGLKCVFDPCCFFVPFIAFCGGSDYMFAFYLQILLRYSWLLRFLFSSDLTPRFHVFLFPFFFEPCLG
jgi:hypothetical protein